MGGGLFDLLVNQIVNPNEQAMNAYFKNGQMPQQQVGGMNGVNHAAMIHQQHLAALGMGGMNGMGMGMGNLGGMGGRMNGMGGMQQMMPYGQLGGYGGGGFGGMRNGWM